jgi:hypothetical protein
MKLGWIKYAVVFLMAFASGAVLMVISHKVQNAQREIIGIDAQVAQEKETIRILSAEWSFLNNPARLEKLSAAYLDLVPAEPQQLVSTMNTVEEELLAEEIMIVDPSMVHAAAYTPSRVEAVVVSPKPKVRRSTDGRPRP